MRREINLRIIAGNAKGNRLMSPKTSKIRPTANRVKEAVFSMIEPVIMDSVVLDLFAGTGSLGLEALSRGARFATFVEKETGALKVLKANINITKFADKSEILFIDALTALHRFGEARRNFDLIFIDPPHGENLYGKTLFLISKYDIIDDKGYLIVEHPVSINLNNTCCDFTPIKNKRYSRTAITIFTKGDNNENRSISWEF